MAMVESPIPKYGEKSKTLGLGDNEDNNSSSSIVEDRLSSLPEDLLVEILSLLPIESAAATSVLSHRWRHLWTQLTRIRFTNSDSPMWRSFDEASEFHKLCTIIDHIVRQLTSPKLRSFHLDFQDIREFDMWKSYASCVQSCIRQICGRNVEEIAVCDYLYTDIRFFSLPTCVFETQSLVMLKLTGWFSYKLPDNGIISLPNLKILRLEVRDSDLELMALLFRSCPLLEDLYLQLYCGGGDHFVDISAQFLKRLTVLGLYIGNQLRIDATQLEYFNISTSCLSAHRFARDLRCLVKAEIRDDGMVSYGHSDYDVSSVEGGVGDPNGMLDIVRGVFSVRSLYLGSIVVDCLYYLHDENPLLPIFHNLTHLEISLCSPNGWNGLFRFLCCSPNLEFLVVSHDEGDSIRDGMYWTIPDPIPLCLLNKLKRMEIEGLQACKKELVFIGFILSNGNVLEQLLLRNFNYIRGGELCKELKFCEELFSFPRSSVACEIEVSW